MYLFVCYFMLFVYVNGLINIYRESNFFLCPYPVSLICIILTLTQMRLTFVH